MTPFPVGGRWRFSLYRKLSDQPWVGGSEYWRLRPETPATGVEATELARASSGLPSTRSICGFLAGTTRPNTRAMAPKIPDSALSVTDASIFVRNGLKRALSLVTSPWYSDHLTPPRNPGIRSVVKSVLNASVSNPERCVLRSLSKSYPTELKFIDSSLIFFGSAVLLVSSDFIFAS